MLWLFFTVHTLIKETPYYQFALNASTEAIQAFRSSYDESSRDFYHVLKTCDNMLPLKAKLQMIFPKDVGKKFLFLTEKGRYILYPRNYGENVIFQDYILIYQVKDLRIPEGYRVLKFFAPDKYLLTNKDPLN